MRAESRRAPAGNSAREVAFLSIERLGDLLRARRLSPVELTRVYLERIERLNPRLNAFLTVTADRALEDARRSEQRFLRRKSLGPLDGIPIALKDNIWTRGVRTTAGSKILAKFVPASDAAVVSRLCAAGAVVLGKTHLHEFAYGVTSNNVHFGPAHNPYDLERIPGGSSGGSAIAVAAGLCAAAVGTDTGGSIRIPAALCGVVGFKPAFGAVSVDGIVPLCVSLDHCGPIARTVGDSALLYQAVRERPAAKPGARSRAGRLRLGWPEEYFFERLAPQVRSAVEATRRVFEKRGVRIVPLKLELIREANHASTPIALAEAHQFHREAGYFPARALEYSEDVRTRLEMGASITAADYLDACAVVRRAAGKFRECASQVEALLAPTVPLSAPRIGAERVEIDGEEEQVRAALLRLCRPANLWGAPAISIPCGSTPDGLPIGLQLIGFEGGEAALLRLAGMYESSTDWHTRIPVLD